jgi:hypothetical protein
LVGDAYLASYRVRKLIDATPKDELDHIRRRAAEREAARAGAAKVAIHDDRG